MINVILYGACGRMGREIIAAAAARKDISIVGGVEAAGHPMINKTLSGVPIMGTTRGLKKKYDCVVDFTTRQAAMTNLASAGDQRLPLVIGTTGFSDRELAKIRRLSHKRPIVLSPNMSIGINHLYTLVELATRGLKDFDIEIIETHHRAKKDAPSGTARSIAKIIKASRTGTRFVFGRSGMTAGRTVSEVGITAVRGGDIVGEHRVLFLGSGEFIELRHYATSRACFAHGVLAAVRFIAGKKHGLFSMADVLKTASGK